MILFLDTVSPLPEFSVIKDNKLVSSIQILNKNSNKISDHIIPVYLKLKKRLKLNDKIEKLIVCTGPGSYTALRVGIAFMYGLSLSKKIKLTGVTSTDLFKFVIPRTNKNNTLMITCSSNNQNFIGIPDDNKGKYLIRKIDIKIQSSEINYNKYNYCVSNYKLSSNIIQNLNLKLYEQINFTEIVRSNLIDILSLPINPLIEPMYISDNKMFN